MILFLKNLFFTLLVPGTVAGVIPWLLVRGRPVASPAYVLAAVACFTVGGAIYLWCLWDFATFGRGTPSPIDAPKRLVVRGLYRYVRNPMYLGVLTVLLGWALLFRAPVVLLGAACLWLAAHLFVLFYEEPHLRRLFGQEYEDYRARVPRWLPFVRAGRAPDGAL